ncbi:NUDIX hydrolase [Thermomonospora cellulosilytica]|uniref:ADP-ribose pyrophosphatase n=1 Tax=Thermomonospora cellulosilytica TaxID=1411118 RepID=A0A7W3MTX4_9ACTN|nr:NUDIX hydrolase [Thermomonospora cellulosilytica]MBA9001794.1 ADP-ribose pyrophosphatase [Thermomonospora cellulosilytica]
MTDADPNHDAYEALRRSRPDLFVNPPGGHVQILPEFPDEHGPYGIRYRDPYVTVVRDPVRFPDGRTGGYLRILHTSGSAGAAVLPVRDGRVVLIRHFRHATRRWHWEIPRGFCDPGETPEQNARRELAEELGGGLHRIEHIGRLHTDTGLYGGVVDLFWAAVGEPTRPSGHEGINDILTLDLPALTAMLERGEITDSFTLAALLHAQARGLAPYG